MGESSTMRWSGKKVFVTGAEGFIGSHVCEAQIHQGSDVTAFLCSTSRGSVSQNCFM